MARKHVFSHRKSIRQEMTALFLFFALIPIAFLAAAAYGSSYIALKNKELDFAQKRLETVIQSLDQQIRMSKNAMASIYLSGSVLKDSNVAHETRLEDFEADRKVEELLSSVSYFATEVNITFVNCRNRVFTNGTPTNSAVKLQEAFLQRIMENRVGWTVLTRSIYTQINVPVVTIGRPIYYKSEFVGVVFADVSYSGLDSIVNQEGLSDYNIYLFDSGDALIYHFGIGEEPQEVSFHALQEGQLESDRYLWVQENGSDSDIKGLAAVPKDEILEGSMTLLIQGVGVILILLTESIVLSRIIGRLVSRDIILLSEAVKRFDQDGQPISLKIDSSDELSRLAEGIERMTQKIPCLLEEVKSKEHEKYELEIKTLMSQIRPHMIYNTLNTITFLAQAQGVNNIAEISNSFIKMLKILANVSENWLTIRQEIDYLNQYIQIKKYNLLIPLRVEFHVEDAALDEQIPKLILQPFVENSIKHGFGGLMEEGIIRIDIERKEQRLVFRIRDNGCGIPLEKQDELFLYRKGNAGIGLANTWKRLQLLYGDRFTLSCESDGKSYTLFCLEIPAEDVQ